ncbi:formate dehydrogenase subunit alpha [Oceanithermus sp.]|nr:formate dehydrogenase subunit alpha [Oceanithermus sp.]
MIPLRIQPDRVVPTVCPYCGVGCRVDLYVKDARVYRVMAREEPPNHGALCVKGRFGLGFLHHPDRLKTPLIRRRKGAELEPVSWEEALDFAADRLARIAAESGPDALYFVSSAKATNEENYLMQKLARAAVGTHNVDHCARLCHSSSTAALSRSLGSAAMSNTLEEIGLSDVILVTGSNTTETHPVVGARIKKAARNGAFLIVADPRRIGLAESAQLWLRLRPGSDAVLFGAMARYLVESGRYDRGFVERRVEGFEAWWESVRDYTLEFAEEASGVPAERIREAAERYAGARAAAIYWAMGITQHSHGTDNAQALINLALLAGQLGKPGAGLNPLRGQNNVQGAGDLGALPNVYPGYQPVADRQVRKRWKALWHTPQPETPGRTMTEAFESIGAKGGVRGIYLMGEDPITSEPYQDHVRAALEKLDLLIVQDILKNETFPYADVVLPAASFAEKHGTFTNTDRRVQRIRPVFEPPGEARPDWWITAQLGRRLAARTGRGWTEGWNYAGPEAVWEEIRLALPQMFGGIDYARLEHEPLRWPCPHERSPGVSVLFTDRFYTPSGKARLLPAVWRPPAERPGGDYPLVLSTGRVLYHWHGGTLSRRSDLEQAYPEMKVEVHPADAERYGISDGEPVWVVSRRGRIQAVAWVTDRTPEGVVFAPFHFAEQPANRLTLDAYDPTSKIPEYKFAAVRLEPAGRETPKPAGPG